MSRKGAPGTRHSGCEQTPGLLCRRHTARRRCWSRRLKEKAREEGRCIHALHNSKAPPPPNSLCRAGAHRVRASFPGGLYDRRCNRIDATVGGVPRRHCGRTGALRLGSVLICCCAPSFRFTMKETADEIIRLSSSRDNRSAFSMVGFGSLLYGLCSVKHPA